MAQTKRIDLVFEGRGTSSGKMRNDIAVTWPQMKESFELATDEGPFHGGDGTAPPPLALFTAALTGCLMTQVRAFAKRMDIEITGVTVDAKLRWVAEQEGRDPYVSHPAGFDLDVDIASAAPADRLHALLDAAKKGCFLEQSLAEGVQVGHRLRIDGEWQDA